MKRPDLFKNCDAETKRTRIVSLVSIAILIALTVVLTLTVGRQIVTFASDTEGFRAWVNSHGLWGKVAFIGMTVLQIVVSIIPGEPFELGAGYCFGAWQGLLLSEIGIVVGSSIVFLFVRKFGTKAVYAFFPKEKIRSFSFLRDAEKRNALVFLLFFIPGTPKDVLTWFVGLTEMKLWEWLLITGIARIPSVLSSTLAGAALGDTNYTQAIIIYGITAVISLIGALVYKKIIAKHNKQ